MHQINLNHTYLLWFPWSENSFYLLGFESLKQIHQTFMCHPWNSTDCTFLEGHKLYSRALWHPCHPSALISHVGSMWRWRRMHKKNPRKTAKCVSSCCQFSPQLTEHKDNHILNTNSLDLIYQSQAQRYSFLVQLVFDTALPEPGRGLGFHSVSVW